MNENTELLVTDKGSINQRAVLNCRADLVAALHDGSLPATILPQPSDKVSP